MGRIKTAISVATMMPDTMYSNASGLRHCLRVLFMAIDQNEFTGLHWNMSTKVMVTDAHTVNAIKAYTMRRNRVDWLWNTLR
jgi:hypothetical protein